MRKHTNCSLSGTLDMKSTSSLLLTSHGFNSFFRNLFVPHRIRRALMRKMNKESLVLFQTYLRGTKYRRMVMISKTIKASQERNGTLKLNTFLTLSNT